MSRLNLCTFTAYNGSPIDDLKDLLADIHCLSALYEVNFEVTARGEFFVKNSRLAARFYDVVASFFSHMRIFRTAELQYPIFFGRDDVKQLSQAANELLVDCRANIYVLKITSANASHQCSNC